MIAPSSGRCRPGRGAAPTLARTVPRHETTRADVSASFRPASGRSRRARQTLARYLFGPRTPMMNTRRGLLAVTLLAAVAAPSTGRAQAGNSRVFGDLLKRIPERSNALMLLNVDGLFDSPMGRREGWREKALANHRGGLGLAADVSRAAVAVGLDFHSMQERWKVGIVQLRRDVPVKLDDLADPGGGLRRDDREHAGRLDPARPVLLRLPGQPRRVRLPGRAQRPRRLVPVGPLAPPELSPRVGRPGHLPGRRRRPDRPRLRPGRRRLRPDGRALAQHVRRDQEDLHRPQAPRAAAGERQVGVPDRQGRPGDRGEPADRLRPRGRLHHPGGPGADPRPPGRFRCRAARDEDLAAGLRQEDRGRDERPAVGGLGAQGPQHGPRAPPVGRPPSPASTAAAPAPPPRGPRRRRRTRRRPPTSGPSPTTSAPRRRTSGRSPR